MLTFKPLAISDEVNALFEHVFFKYMKDTEDTVATLCQEYTRKKRAWEMTQRLNYDTGDLDVGLLHAYKYSEDLFRQDSKQKQGKSHGIVMLVDWSGSMSSCILNTVCQALILARFADRMKIPFEAFNFTLPLVSNVRNEAMEDLSATGLPIFSAHTNPGYVRCILSSTLGSKKLREAMYRLFVLAIMVSDNHTFEEKMIQEVVPGSNAYNINDALNNWSSHRYYGSNSQKYLGSKFSDWVANNTLSGSTSLNNALLAMLSYLPQFKAQNRVQNLLFVPLTDGGDNVSVQSANTGGYGGQAHIGTGESFLTFYVEGYPKLFSYDEVYGEAPTGNNMTYGTATGMLYQAIRETCRAKVVGMFLTGNENARSWVYSYTGLQQPSNYTPNGFMAAGMAYGAVDKAILERKKLDPEFNPDEFDYLGVKKFLTQDRMFAINIHQMPSFVEGLKSRQSYRYGRGPKWLERRVANEQLKSMWSASGKAKIEDVQEMMKNAAKNRKLNRMIASEIADVICEDYVIVKKKQK